MIYFRVRHRWRCNHIDCLFMLPLTYICNILYLMYLKFMKIHSTTDDSNTLVLSLRIRHNDVRIYLLHNLNVYFIIEEYRMDLSKQLQSRRESDHSKKEGNIYHNIWTLDKIKFGLRKKKKNRKSITIGEINPINIYPSPPILSSIWKLIVKHIGFLEECVYLLYDNKRNRKTLIRIWL